MKVKEARVGSYCRYFQKTMTSSGGNDVINDAEIFTKDANSYLVHTGQILFQLDKYFERYQKNSFRMHDGLITYYLPWVPHVGLSPKYNLWKRTVVFFRADISNNKTV